MKRILPLALTALLFYSSCDLLSGDYGEKVTIGKNEVYYKGDGVTEQQAKETGAFLLEANWFDDKEPGSAQITKDSAGYLVHLVAHKNKISDHLRRNLWKTQRALSASVFNNQKVRFAFADDNLNDFETLSPVDVVTIGQGTVYYDSEAFTKAEAQDLADFLDGAGYLNQDKQVDVLLRKEGGAPVVRMIVDRDALAQNEAEVMLTFGYWQSLLQDVVFSKNAKIVLTDTDFNDIKPVPAISKADKEALEAEMAK